MDPIIAAINKFFISVDNRNWEEVAAALCDEVLLDYSSMAGGSPVQLQPRQIVDTWKALLPGFDKTHHQLGNFLVDQAEEMASVFFYGTASHYLVNESGHNLWTVVGSYESILDLIASRWRIRTFKFNLKFIDGNTALPAMAKARAAQAK